MFDSTLAQTTYGAESGSAGMIPMLVMMAVIVTAIAGMWRVFSKAGQPGWGVLVPIYNVLLMCKIAQRPAWWLILLFVPVVNMIIAVIMSIDIARRFGKGTGFGVGLAFLGFIFYPILGFGGAQYDGSPTGMDMNTATPQGSETPAEDQHEEAA